MSNDNPVISKVARKEFIGTDRESQNNQQDARVIPATGMGSPI